MASSAANLTDSSSVIALALELVIWFTHSLVGNGVCFAFVGFFLGPVYPNALMLVSEVLDDDLRAGVMGIMGSMGGAGAAAVPLYVSFLALLTYQYHWSHF